MSASSDPNVVRLGVIGLGYMAQGVHLPCFSRAQGCQISAVADVDQGLAARVAAKWDIPIVCGSTSELLESDEIDAVALLVPPQFIAALAVEAVENGKHVFCEKPVAFTKAANEAVIDAAAKAGRKVMVAFQKRYDLGVQYAKGLLGDPPWRQKLGRITFARFHNFCGSFRGDLEQPYEQPERNVEYAALGGLDLPDWLEKAEENLFFCAYTNCSHDLNLMRHLLGDPKGTVAGFRVPGANDWLPYATTMFDYGEFCTTFEYGLVEHDDFDEWFQIYFERGWIEARFNRVLLRDVPAKVSVMTQSEGTIIPRLGYGWSFQRQAEDFVQCCLTDRRPLTDVQDTLGDTLLAEPWFLSGR